MFMWRTAMRRAASCLWREVRCLWNTYEESSGIAGNGTLGHRPNVWGLDISLPGPRQGCQ